MSRAAAGRSRAPRPVNAPRAPSLACRASRLLICLALAAAPVRAPAQGTQGERDKRQSRDAPTRGGAQDDEVLRVNTNLVQIDAVVTDKSGRQVTDLRAEDFEIVEDGRVRVPEYFSYVSLGGARSKSEGGAAGHPAAYELRRTFAFVVSNPVINVGFSFPGRVGGPPSAGSYSTQAGAVNAAEETHKLLTWFVDTQMSDCDLVAVADTDVDIGVLSSFTNDREVLRAAIDRVRDDATNGRSPSLNVMATSDGVLLQPLLRQNLNVLETLAAVVSQVERLPGRKVVALVARGFLYNPYLPYSDVVRERLRQLIERANRAHVAIYTLRPVDLNPEGGNRGSDAMNRLAQETGGRAIYNTNDLRVGFGEILEETRGYYLLAYNPGAQTAERPHQIKVRVKREGLRVLTRAQAFAPGASRVPASVSTTLAALSSPLASKEIALTLSPSLDATATARTPRVVVSLVADISEAQPFPTANALPFFTLELSVRVTAPDGHLIKSADRSIKIEPKDGNTEAVKREGFATRFEFDADKPGFYRINAVLRDAFSGRVGSATRFFKVEPTKGAK